MGLWGAIKRALDGAPDPTTAPSGAAVVPIDQFPAPRRVDATEQALKIIGELQDEGRSGFVPLGQILMRYPEYCLGFGWEPIAHSTLNEALGEFCERQRPRVGHRQKITGFVIPEPGAVPWKHLPHKAPNGNVRAIQAAKTNGSARAGAAA